VISTPLDREQRKEVEQIAHEQVRRRYYWRSTAWRSPYSNELLYGVGLYLVLASLLLAALSLVDRLRRASGDERQQLKWFALATGMMLGVRRGRNPCTVAAISRELALQQDVVTHGTIR
jgi:hypothetical protein